MTQKKYLSLILILGSLVALGPFSIDMYLPGFKAIARDLLTTESRVSWSLSSYFIGLSAGQLLYGPLLDRFGRKKPLYVGLAVYVLASAGCVLVKDIDTFIWLRFLQALGGCSAGVAAIAMVRDLFPVKDNAKVFSLLMLVLGVSPMIAPTVGGYVTVAFGWHAVFLILLVLGLINLAASWLWLPEVYKADTSMSLKPKPIISNFLAVLREPQFSTYAIAGALAFAGLFVYVTSSPVLFMSIFNVGEKTYGWIFALLSVGFIGGSQVNTLLLKKFKSEQLIYAALSGQAATAIIFLAGSIGGWFGLTETILLLFIFLSCLGITNPNAAALSMAPFSRNAGSASSMMGALQMGLGAFASACIGFFEQQTVLPMVSIMAATSLLGLGVLARFRASQRAANDPGLPGCS
ncbi:DHA1 family bicyclomycin/chloramphenicol resistance-like MFS transporter [Anseongella ginsenosidimutans]|uniref:DHA1 family bicyclomycin/chloramphenicol resistance-like MFS transporter n=1 Tax=Anseongella ginsenosidimutans TaxID=496056 RepID=A0A4R3KVM5_9SPHI|nr:multidrug effflux MFS transporter [Anseongella ginsenosidimutans]QEC51842.1 multidrug effflux MFS transporter [Anseongella ginsenosidimutans]TCS89218.1 DHA1 family bicyclomycin/chloramphenicol resistance-like MFS transporter [Anseongella ginsenosidimutans]